MFYFHEVLNKRGKFGIIWLAATAPQRVKKRDFLGVNVVKSAEDILEILTRYPSIAGKRKVRFSLYLSSQLMFGLISAYNKQCRILFEDTKDFLKSVQSFHGRQLTFSGVIDLEETPSRDRVTMDEPNFQNAPVDFGKFWTETETLNLPIEDYFLVPTPRSSLLGSYSSEHLETIAAETFDSGDRLTARVEDITMPEAPVEEPVLEEIVPELFDGFLEEMPVPPLPELEPAPGIAERVQEEPEVPHEAETAEEQPHVEITPAIPERESPLVRDQEAQDQQAIPTPETSSRLPEPERQDAQPRDRDQDQRDKDKKDKDKKDDKKDKDKKDKDKDKDKKDKKAEKRLFDDSESSAETVFELEPITPRRRRRRKRFLIIDDEKMIPSRLLKQNMALANERLVRPLELPDLVETAESMFLRFGLRAAARGNKKFWPNPKTLPEPNDPSRYGAFSGDSYDTSGMFVEETMVDVTPGDSRERGRAGSTFESTGIQDLPDAPSRSTTFSRHLQESREQVSATRISLQVPEISAADDLSGMRSEHDVLGDIPVETLSTTEVIPEPVIPEPQSHREPSRELESTIPEPIIPELESRRESVRRPELETPEGRRSREPSRRLRDEQSESTRKKIKTCVVSPEKTPPPSSPTPPSSPLLEDAVRYITAALAESTLPNKTTFSAVLELTPKTKVYVAKMFNWLLSMHARGMVSLDQSEPNGEIFITLL